MSAGPLFAGALRPCRPTWCASPAICVQQQSSALSRRGHDGADPCPVQQGLPVSRLRALQHRIPGPATPPSGVPKMVLVRPAAPMGGEDRAQVGPSFCPGHSLGLVLHAPREAHLVKAIWATMETSCSRFRCQRLRGPDVRQTTGSQGWPTSGALLVVSVLVLDRVGEHGGQALPWTVTD